jgi:FkbM family methyltransferase
LLKSLVKHAARRFGLDVHRFDPSVSEAARAIAMLSAHGVDLVLDVGANTGQFATGLREAGYRGKILSFEPLSSAHAQLVDRSRHDPMWDVFPRAALGSEDGEIEIHVSGNSVSSSVLGMLDAHALSAPESAYVSNERVPLRRLDGIVPSPVGSGAVTLLKVDAQGYEDRVLQGAAGFMPCIAGVQLELSLVPLYEEQRLFSEMTTDLRDSGFNLWSVAPAFVDSRTGRVLQIDATFFRD